MDLHEFVNSGKVAKEAISTRARQIYEVVLSTSPYLTTGNFKSFHPDDLGLLFREYDQRFLDGHCREELGDHVLRFRISKRMTKAAGSATRYKPRRGPGRPHYEIAVSSTLLFQCFLHCAESKPIRESPPAPPGPVFLSGLRREDSPGSLP